MSLSLERFGRLLYAMCTLASGAGGGGVAGVLLTSAPSDRSAAFKNFTKRVSARMNHGSSLKLRDAGDRLAYPRGGGGGGV